MTTDPIRAWLDDMDPRMPGGLSGRPQMFDALRAVLDLCDERALRWLPDSTEAHVSIWRIRAAVAEALGVECTP